MNKQEFEQAIEKIGWSIQKSWNGLNDKLVSPTGASPIYEYSRTDWSRSRINYTVVKVTIC